MRFPESVFDTNTSAAENEVLGPLPEWDLSDLYESPDCAQLEADFHWVEEESQAFAESYKDKLGTLDAGTFLEALQRYEALATVMGRIMSYAGLRYYTHTDDTGRAKFMGDAQARLTDASSHTLFFTLEINRLGDPVVAGLIGALPELARYKTWLERTRSMRPHQLSDELENFLHDQSVVGASAWNRLFDETMASLSFEVEGEAEPMPLETTLNLLSKQDRDKRAAAAAALSTVFSDNIRLFTLITNTLAKEKEIEDKWRKMPTPEYGRHMANHVEPEVVEALRSSVQAAYPRLSHRYYALKAGWLGLERLEYWDRNAPLPEKDDRVIGWEEARETVLAAYGGFDSRMAGLAREFFDKPWIDAPVKAGKAPGAFAHPTVVDVHPYVMLNYLGQTRDVMTLAHELGHGVHQLLAAEQGELLSRTPLTLAETASVFGEMLTFQSVLGAEIDPAKRKILLAGKVEDMINTVVRQIAFYEYELRLHRARQKGELTPEDIGEIWMAVQTESLGPAINLGEGYENFWCSVPHFIHSPFYVYAYAFGDGLVNALYGVYEEAQAAGDSSFADKYFDMLRAGGSKHHSVLLAPFGLDATDPGFWQKGLGVIERMIDELEGMEA